ncbi:MAG: hypothetical protein ABIP93_06525 [Gemmatimonadaceae bacterium]
MAKTILFLLHGMGRFEKEWAKETIAQLNELPDTYDYSWITTDPADGTTKRTFADLVDCIPIQYDHVFDRYLKQWGASTEALSAKAKEFGVDLSRVLGWLEHADEVEKNFFWTHVVDVLLYRFFSIVTAEVRVRVRDAIAEKLEEASRDGQIVSASVLAYSLGTAVAHDALALLGTQPIPTPAGPNNAWLADNFTFDSIFMCANVGRVLETVPRVYQSVVRPATSVDQPSYFNSYYNFRHALDPFPAVRPFGPLGWGSRYIEGESGTKVMQFDVHSFTHYLADPRVHALVYRGLFGSAAVSAPQFKKAKTQYDALPEPKCIAELTHFKSAAQRIIALAQTGADPNALVIGGVQFLAAAEEARVACP